MDIGNEHSLITWGTTWLCMNEMERLFRARLTSVGWNAWNKVVQDHSSGTVCLNLTNRAREHLGLPVPWTPELAATEDARVPVYWKDMPVPEGGATPLQLAERQYLRAQLTVKTVVDAMAPVRRAALEALTEDQRTKLRHAIEIFIDGLQRQGAIPVLTVYERPEEFEVVMGSGG